MRRHPPPLLVLAPSLRGGCHPKRPPAVLTDPGRTAREHPPATATPEDQPINTGPDIQPLGRDNPTGEDFSVNDPSGENGPLEDVHFDYDQAVLSDQARAILEKHALWLQNHRQAEGTPEGH